jgi:hypothetical protein
MRYAEWRLRRVGINYQVEVEAHFYSVPYRFTATTVCAAGPRRCGIDRCAVWPPA